MTAKRCGGNDGLCRQRLIAVQLFIVMVILTTQVSGLGNWGNVSKLGVLTKSVARGLVRAPSKIMDGGQYATHKVASAVSTAVSPIKPLQKAVDLTGGALSNVLGSTSRLLGKKPDESREVMFLYGRSLDKLKDRKLNHEAVKVIIGHALTNLVLHKDEMAASLETDDSAETMDGKLQNTPRLRETVKKLEDAGAPTNDLRLIISLMGLNGNKDIPDILEPKIMGTLTYHDDRHERTIYADIGLMEELRWIWEHANGFHQMDPREITDYRLHSKYGKFTTLYPISNTEFINQLATNKT